MYFRYYKIDRSIYKLSIFVNHTENIYILFIFQLEIKLVIESKV